MQVQLRIQHVQTGKTWVNPPTEMTQEEVDLAAIGMKESLADLTYIEVEGDVLPGDFVRQQCVLRFIFPTE